MIESKNLSFSYGSNLVLDSVEFTAQTGKITYFPGKRIRIRYDLPIIRFRREKALLDK